MAASGQDSDTVAQSLASALRTMHRVSEDSQDFSITTASSMQAAISSVSDTLGIFLGESLPFPL
ncbi:hypothetical protein AUJ17_00520 [Candidatus Micrarchaeota archaeon CG1_02_47_40]|nr:MAG: hypothetical protein AUJ17_00520 [Candidatus Micrarchaeota archaeon CG1_02_47_40]